jgi:hypothetical protein
MSAQCYTNKTRVIAEASLRKIQYPGSIGLNNNPIYAAINCNTDFSQLIYVINRCCVKRSVAQPLRAMETKSKVVKLLIILSGGNAISKPLGTVSGGGASTITVETISGGEPSEEVYVEVPEVPEVERHDWVGETVAGGGASTITIETVTGGDCLTFVNETIICGGA